MKSIVFIIPYFVGGDGKLPNYFPLWLKTCEYNPSINFLFFTDDKSQYNYPENVKVIYLSFQDIAKLIQDNYDFSISLERPYKLCDFKPAFGDIFRKYIAGYDFWGHCDIDMFWGNIRHFITDEILENYDRIYTRGHCSIYRNNDEVNSWYRTLPANGYQTYREVFTSPQACCFDEWAGHCGGGISKIISSNNIKQYDAVDMADLNTAHSKFIINRESVKHGGLYFRISEAGVIGISKTYQKQYIYVHFQKRTLKIYGDINKSYFLFVSPNVVLNRLTHNYLIKKIFYRLNYLSSKLNRKIAKNK